MSKEEEKEKWIKYISYGIFPCELRVFYGMTYKEIRENLIKDLPESVHYQIKRLKGKYDGRTTIFSTGQTVIVLNENTYDVIAHEAFHATEMLLSKLKIRHCNNTSEVYAYMTGYIVGEITTKNSDIK